MNIVEDFGFFLTTLFFVIIVIIVNHTFLNYKYRLLINFILFVESATLTFFLQYPLYLSPITLVLSLYYTFFIISNETNINPKKIKLPNFLFSYRVFISIFLLISLIVYEYFADQEISPSGFVILIISFILFFYEEFPKNKSFERDFVLIFLGLLFTFFVIPDLIYKVAYGYVGENNKGDWFDSDKLVYLTLGKPLEIMLNLSGFEVQAIGQEFLFKDSDGSTNKVFVSKGCSGIYSIAIFLSALISYLFLISRSNYDLILSISIIGIFVSYLANLARMYIIVLVGYYKDMDTMLLVHEYLGWFIFTFWIFIFWLVLENFIIKEENSIKK